ncbi:hypothetical protein ACFL96_15720 [Thermoproteota archaeon]
MVKKDKSDPDYQIESNSSFSTARKAGNYLLAGATALLIGTGVARAEEPDTDDSAPTLGISLKVAEGQEVESAPEPEATAPEAKKPAPKPAPEADHSAPKPIPEPEDIDYTPSPYKGSVYVGGVISGDGKNISTYPNFVGGDFTFPNDLQLRLFIPGGFMSPDSPRLSEEDEGVSPQLTNLGYESEQWGIGVVPGITIPMAKAGTLDLDLAYMHKEARFLSDTVEVDNPEGFDDDSYSAGPDLNHSENSFGAILDYLIAQDGIGGRLRAEVGYNHKASGSHKTIEKIETTIDDPAEEQNTPPGSGLTITQDRYLAKTKTSTREYNTDQTNENIGFMIHYMTSPDWIKFFVEHDVFFNLGFGGGLEKHKFKEKMDHEFNETVELSGYNDVVITDNTTGEEIDSDHQVIDETETADPAHVDETLRESNKNGFIDVLLRYQHIWSKKHGNFGGRVALMGRAYTKPLGEIQDDEAKLDGAIFAMIQNIPIPKFPLHLSTHLLTQSRQYEGTIMILGGDTDENLVEDRFQTITYNRFGFQPWEVQHMRNQLANTRLMSGLDGMLLGYSQRNGEETEHRGHAGWGFKPVAIVGEYAYGEIEDLASHDVALGVTLKRDLLKHLDLNVGAGIRFREDPNGDGSDLADYRVLANAIFRFGGGEE